MRRNTLVAGTSHADALRSLKAPIAYMSPIKRIFTGMIPIRDSTVEFSKLALMYEEHPERFDEMDTVGHLSGSDVDAHITIAVQEPLFEYDVREEKNMWKWVTLKYHLYYFPNDRTGNRVFSRLTTRIDETVVVLARFAVKRARGDF